MAKGITVDLSVRMASYEASINKAIADLRRFQDEAKTSSKQITSSIDGIGAGMSKTIASFIGVGSAIAAIGSIKSFVTDTVNAADRLGDLSLVLGVSVENLSGLGLAAKQAGTDVESVATAINKMYVKSAKDPAGFASIGLTAKDGIGQLKQLADKFASMESVEDRSALANAAYGKSWQGMATMLAGGGKAIDEAIAKAKEIGVVTAKEAEAAKKFNEHMDEVHLKWQRFAMDIGNVALPAISSFFSAMEVGIDRLKNKWSLVKAAKELLTDQFGASRPPTPSIAVPDEIAPTGKKKTTRAERAFIEGYDLAKEANSRLMENAERFQKDFEARTNSAAKTEQLLYDNRIIAISTFYDSKRIREQAGLDHTIATYEKEIAITKKSLKGGNLDTLAEQESAAKAIRVLKDKIEAAKIAGKNVENENVYAEDKAVKEYTNSVRALSAAYLELQGKMGEAARINLDIQYQPLEKQAGVEQNQQALEKIKQLKELGAARADANALEVQATNIQTDLTNIEARLTLQQKAGTLTELGLIHEIDAARGKSVVELKKLVAEYEELAKASGDPKLLRDAETLKVKLGELEQASHQLADKFNTIFQSAGSSAFESFINGTKSAKDAFRVFVSDVVQQINRIAAQQLSQALFGGSSSGGGGLGGIIAGYLGGTGGSTVQPSTGGFVPTDYTLANGISSFAVGTNYVPKDMIARIHEGEAVVPKKYNVQGYGRVNTTRMTSVVNNFMLTQQTDNRSQSQIAASAARGISIATRRNT